MSGKLNTKDVKAGGDGGTPKGLGPGNHKCKINHLRAEEFKLKPGSIYITIGLEGEDLGKDFEGFFLNKDNEALGRHKGQVANVKTSEWAYADGKTKSGLVVSRDADIMKFMKNLCIALGVVNWFDAQNDKHDTIYDLINAFNTERPFAGKFINYCISGKEYTNKSGYLAYELFLPKYSKTGSAFGTNCVTFNPAEHIRKKKAETVAAFGEEESTTMDQPDHSLSGPASGDFKL